MDFLKRSFGCKLNGHGDRVPLNVMDMVEISMKWVACHRLIPIAILIAIGGCGWGDFKHVAIDDHEFSVPRNHIVNATIFFLPSSQSDGLTFYVNPNDDPERRIIVGIETTAITCPKGISLGASALASACQSATLGAGHHAADGKAEIEKVNWNGDDPTQWDYRLAGGPNAGAIVASCFAMKKGNGLCHYYGIYKNLVYSFNLGDDEIENIPEIKNEIYQLLSSWENNW